VINEKILITCSVNNKSVPTGFRAPVGTDITHLKHITMPNCLSCGGVHIWEGEDGYWEEDPPPKPLPREHLLNKLLKVRPKRTKPSAPHVQ